MDFNNYKSYLGIADNFAKVRVEIVQVTASETKICQQRFIYYLDNAKLYSTSTYTMKFNTKIRSENRIHSFTCSMPEIGKNLSYYHRNVVWRYASAIDFRRLYQIILLIRRVTVNIILSVPILRKTHISDM